jgi:sucrose-6-phosphate hydrolase SacC (GH32 family)
MPFNQGMAFPVTLSLHTTEDGLRLFFEPVREIETLYRGKRVVESQALHVGKSMRTGDMWEWFDLQAQFALGEAQELGLIVRGVPVLYDVRQETLSCLGKSLPLRPVDGRICLRLLVDRTSLEIFANAGRVYLPLGVVFEAENRALEVFARGEGAQIEELVIHELASIWE